MKKLLVMAVLVGLAACNPANTGPSVQLAKDALSARIAKGMQGAPFEIVSFEKTNGMDIEGFGAKGYEMMYSAKVSYPQGVRPQCISNNDTTCFFGPGFPRAQLPGSTETMVGTLDFQKTERGWVFSG